jgi:hypothetical protein
LWVLALLLPTIIIALPFWTGFAAAMDHSLNAAHWSQQLDAIVLNDVMSRILENGFAIGQAGFTAVVLTLLLSPFLTGMVITSARAPSVPGFGMLMQGGVREYGRLLRMMVWALFPLGLAVAIGSAGLHWAEKSGERVILESAAEIQEHLAMGLMGILVLLAHATVDAGRAQFALFGKRRSAIKAWWRGLKTLRHGLLSLLGSYVVWTILGLLLAAVLTALRLAIPQLGVVWMLLGIVLAQLVIAIVAWMRIARLLTLIAHSHNQVT